MHALMYILHEVVEMNAGLGLDIGRQGIEEQIHKHGLSTPNVAKHVQTLGEGLGNRRFWRFFATTAEQRSKERLFRLGVQGRNGWMDDGGRSIILQSLVKVLQVLNNCYMEEIQISLKSLAGAYNTLMF